MFLYRGVFNGKNITHILLNMQGGVKLAFVEKAAVGMAWMCCPAE
jgi:hypothetical protein